MEQKQTKTSKPYSPELRECAVQLLMEHRREYQSEATALTAIAGKLGCSPDSLRGWTRQIQRDDGERPGPTSAVIDVFARGIVGWRTSTSMKPRFVLDVSTAD